jgi:hypothetical protein
VFDRDDEPFWRHIAAVARAYVEDGDAAALRLRLFRRGFTPDQIARRLKELDEIRAALPPAREGEAE